MRQRLLPLIVTVPLLVATSCMPLEQDASVHDCDDSYRQTEQPAAIAGRWILPPDVLAAGQAQYLPYEGAGPWNGGASCTGTFTAGARHLADQLVEWTDVSHYGGYNCRRNTGNTSQLSVHGTGRAVDLFIPLDGGQADNDKGDPVANWLIENAEHIGIQFIVWDRTSWGISRSGTKERAYTGPHPHHDHLHIELTSAASRMETPYFVNGGQPGCEASCDGNIIHDRSCGTGDCAAFGASCVDDNFGVRCVSPLCPAQGSADTCLNDVLIGSCVNGGVVSSGDCSVYGSRCVNDELGARCVFSTCEAQGNSTGCVDQDRIATCTNGQAEIGDCSAFAAHCSTTGGSGAARCVSYFCAQPDEPTFAHQSCFLDGELLSCDGEGRFESKTACPAGSYCSVYPEPHCETGQNVCPAWDGVVPSSSAEVEARTTTHCLGDTVIATCLSGAVSGANDCAEVESYCSTAGGVEPRCVSVHCVDDANQAPVAHDLCLAETTIGHCREDGKLEFTECEEGAVCLDDGTVRCEGGDNNGANNTGANNTGANNGGANNTGANNTGANNGGENNGGANNTGANNTGANNGGGVNNIGANNTGANNGGENNAGDNNNGATDAPPERTAVTGDSCSTAATNGSSSQPWLLALALLGAFVALKRR